MATFEELGEEAQEHLYWAFRSRVLNNMYWTEFHNIPAMTARTKLEKAFNEKDFAKVRAIWQEIICAGQEVLNESRAEEI